MPYYPYTDPYTGISVPRYVGWNEPFTVNGQQFSCWQEYLDWQADFLFLSLGYDPWGINGATISPVIGGTRQKQPQQPDVQLSIGQVYSPTPYVDDSGLHAAVIEGVKFHDGDQKIYSTGRCKFALITGWGQSANAKEEDGLMASHSSPSAGVYTGKLVAKQPQIALPDGASIVGVKVYVKRRRIT